MQHRMKEFPMTEEAISALLERAVVGRISTVGEDGYPYTVAVHYIYEGTPESGTFYFHGLPKGEKLDNIARDPRVCFVVDEFQKLLDQDLATPCNADAAYESVVARGKAELVEDLKEKERILRAIICKYLPGMAEAPMPEARIAGTAVVKVKVERMTGKYHV